MSLESYGGSFENYYSAVNKCCGESQVKVFENLSSDYEKVEQMAKVLSKNGLDIKVVKNLSNKNEAKSIHLRELANNAFRMKKWLDAMVLYGESYIHMPQNKKEQVSVLLANRSAALFHLGEYEKCLQDISRAFDMEYPKEKLYKIYEREARCYLATKRYSRAIESFKKTIAALDHCCEYPEKRAKLEQDALVMIKILENDKAIEKPVKSRPVTPIKEKYVHQGIFIDNNPQEGRFVKSKQQISVGEKIVSENPYAYTLLEKFSKTHCQHCFRRTTSPVCCDSCTDVIFCNDSCLHEAQKSYHKFECGVLPEIWKSGASLNCHLALRIIASQNLQYFLEHKDVLENDISYEHIAKLPDGDYRQVYFLVRHKDRRNYASFFQYSLMANFLTKCLEAGGYFEGHLNVEGTLYINSLVLRNLQLLQFNTHEISELHVGEENKKSVFIGGGVYPTLALFNHSCNPSITKYFDGVTVHVHSITPISPNDSIFENYGPLFTQEGKNERQKKLLDLYWFDCRCEACTEDWSLYENMENTIIRFRCESTTCRRAINVPINYNEFMVKCAFCGSFTNIIKGLKVMQDVESMKKTAEIFYSTGKMSSAFKKYVDIVKIMHQVLVPPFTDYCEVQQKIKDCLTHFGNKYISL